MKKETNISAHSDSENGFVNFSYNYNGEFVYVCIDVNGKDITNIEIYSILSDGEIHRFVSNFFSNKDIVCLMSGNEALANRAFNAYWDRYNTHCENIKSALDTMLKATSVSKDDTKNVQAGNTRPVVKRKSYRTSNREKRRNK